MLRKRMLLFVVLMLLFCRMVQAQQKYTTTKGEKDEAITYKLVSTEHLEDRYSRPFYLPSDGSGILKPKIFFDNTSLGKNNSLGNSNILLMNQNIVSYYDKSLVLGLDGGAYFFKSENLKYFGRGRHTKLPTKDENGVTLIEFFDDTGKKYLERRMSASYEESGWTYHISDKGEILEIESFKGIIRVFNPNGTLRAEKTFFKKAHRGNGFQVKFSGNGQYIALNAFHYSMKTTIVTAMLVDFDLNVIFNKQLDHESRMSINVNDDASVIVACSAEFRPTFKPTTSIFNRKNGSNVKLDNTLSQTTRVKFYNDLIILGSQRSMLIYDIEKDSTIYRQERLALMAYDYAPEKGLLFILQGVRAGGDPPMVTNVSVEVYNLNRVPVYVLSLGNIINSAKMAMTCSKDADQFMLQVGTDIYTYKAVR